MFVGASTQAEYAGAAASNSNAAKTAHTLIVFNLHHLIVIIAEQRKDMKRKK